METLAVPLRIDRSGKFARGDRVDAIIAVFSAMLTSDPTLWAHAPWFGLAQVALDRNPDKTEHGALRDAFNIALQQLGIEWAEVRGVSTQRESSGGTVQFELALAVDGEDVVFRSLSS